MSVAPTAWLFLGIAVTIHHEVSSYKTFFAEETSLSTLIENRARNPLQVVSVSDIITEYLEFLAEAVSSLKDQEQKDMNIIKELIVSNWMRTVQPDPVTDRMRRVIAHNGQDSDKVVARTYRDIRRQQEVLLFYRKSYTVTPAFMRYMYKTEHGKDCLNVKIGKLIRGLVSPIYTNALLSSASSDEIQKRYEADPILSFHDTVPLICLQTIDAMFSKTLYHLTLIPQAMNINGIDVYTNAIPLTDLNKITLDQVAAGTVTWEATKIESAKLVKQLVVSDTVFQQMQTLSNNKKPAPKPKPEPEPEPEEDFDMPTWINLRRRQLGTSVTPINYGVKPTPVTPMTPIDYNVRPTPAKPLTPIDYNKPLIWWDNDDTTRTEDRYPRERATPEGTGNPKPAKITLKTRLKSEAEVQLALAQKQVVAIACFKPTDENYIHAVSRLTFWSTFDVRDDVVYHSVDLTETHPQFIDKYGIKTTPTFFFFIKGELAKKYRGCMPEDLKQIVESLGPVASFKNWRQICEPLPPEDGECNY